LERGQARSKNRCRAFHHSPVDILSDGDCATRQFLLAQNSQRGVATYEWSRFQDQRPQIET
jgi:hypothetical protein